MVQLVRAAALMALIEEAEQDVVPRAWELAEVYLTALWVLVVAAEADCLPGLALAKVVERELAAVRAHRPAEALQPCGY